MTVELIAPPASGEVVDLTGGVDHSVEPTEQTTDGVEVTDTPDSSDTAPTDITDNPDDNEGDSGTPDADNEDTTEYFFNGQAVQVEVPDEISTQLTEAGLDPKAVVGELFAKDGEFNLSEETRNKLEEKFGKTLVDGYLNMYKGLNEQALSKHTAELESKTALEEEQGKAYSEAVGGEEGLVKMEDHIINNFSDDQIAAYNAVMETGDHASQLLIISQVKSIMKMQDKLENGDDRASIIGDNHANHQSDPSPADKGFLTYEEYQEITASDKYWEDPAYAARMDKARLAGQKR